MGYKVYLINMYVVYFYIEIEFEGWFGDCLYIGIYREKKWYY